MAADFLQQNNIPCPSLLAGWEELEHVRILRFKGPVNGETLPKMLQLRDQLQKAGLTA